MDTRAKHIEDFKKQGIIITEEQYDELALIDCSASGRFSVNEILKILKIMKLI